MSGQASTTFTPGLPGREATADEPKPVLCQICGGETVPGLDLGSQPVSDLVVAPVELNEPETFYPLRLHHCHDCGLTQLGYIVDPAVVYRNFPFVSGTTQTATQYLQSLAHSLVEMGDLDANSFAVDIGSNDGTLLKGYIPHGVRFIGVDPAGDPVRIANAQGIETLHAFFDEATAQHILETYGAADAISAAGVFGHIAEFDGLMRGVKALLSDRGIFATDNQYWLDMVERLHYDNVFHQHLRYYALRPLTRLFAQYDMELFDIERSSIHGGSIRVFACHSGAYPISSRVEELRELEERVGLYERETHERFTAAVEERRRTLFDAVYSLASAEKKVVGIGAPAKASTVCNYCRLGPDLVTYITEVNPLRIGMFLPGVHIPILDEQLLFTDSRPADAGILFAWNYYDEIVPRLREQGFAGELISP
jgi:C-methyltransferase C-terminal domain/Putative zinc binding domain/Methyltransferase domain